MTAGDKPRDRAHAFVPSTRPGYEHTCSVSGCGALAHDEEHTGGDGIDDPRTDKPRPDLVVLFDAFARLPSGHASLSLFGSEHEAVFRGWAARHGHRVDEQPLANATEGSWIALSVTLAGGYITIHLDGLKEQPEAAEGSV